MCAPDYFCAMSGPAGCPIPTSYPVPLVGQQYLYDPRSTDRCRRDSNSVAIQVEHLVDVTVGANAATLTIHQQCNTRMRNDGTSPTSYVNDSRDWTTVLTFCSVSASRLLNRPRGSRWPRRRVDRARPRPAASPVPAPAGFRS